MNNEEMIRLAKEAVEVAYTRSKAGAIIPAVAINWLQRQGYLSGLSCDQVKKLEAAVRKESRVAGENFIKNFPGFN